MKIGRKTPRKGVSPPKTATQKSPEPALSVSRKALDASLELPQTPEYKDRWGDFTLPVGKEAPEIKPRNKSPER